MCELGDTEHMPSGCRHVPTHMFTYMSTHVKTDRRTYTNARQTQGLTLKNDPLFCNLAISKLSSWITFVVVVVFNVHK